jgi:Tfp pilus assembly protein PilF
MLSSYAVLYAAFGPNPTMFHIFQLALHISNAIIVLFLMSSFFPLVLSFLTALIFLVHPINSETVVHSANLQEVLFFFFGSLSLLILQINKYKQLSWKAFLLFLLCLLLSVFSKETGLLFGLISLIYVFLFSKKNIIKIVEAIIIVAITLFILRFYVDQINFDMPIFSPIAHASLFTRMLNMPSIFVQYLKTFIFPVSLETAQFWLYEKITISGFFVPLFICIIFIALVILVAVLILKKNKKLLPVYIFFTMWFILGISIHLQIIPLKVIVAERWFYLPIVGLLGMIATTCQAYYFKKLILRKAGLIIFLIIIGLFAARTFIRVFDWKDSETLFTHDLKIAKGNYLLENNLGTLYIRNGEYEKALPLVRDSVSKYQYFGNLNNMAVLFVHEKNLLKAEEYFKKALQGGSSFMVYQNYSYFLLYFKKDYKEAYRISYIAIQKYPSGSSLYLIKAQAEYHLGNYNQALSDAKTANELFPSQWTKEVYNAIQAKKEIQVEKFYKLD